MVRWQSQPSRPGLFEALWWSCFGLAVSRGASLSMASFLVVGTLQPLDMGQDRARPYRVTSLAPPSTISTRSTSLQTARGWVLTRRLGCSAALVSQSIMLLSLGRTSQSVMITMGGPGRDVLQPMAANSASHSAVVDNDASQPERFLSGERWRWAECINVGRRCSARRRSKQRALAKMLLSCH